MLKRLPQPNALRVEKVKVVEYLLNPNHPQGASKANFFVRFGFDISAWEVLADALCRHGRERSVIERQDTGFGLKFVVECHIETPDQQDPCIRSVWILEEGAPPRLVTAYPAT